jgi:hypothetical protein
MGPALEWNVRLVVFAMVLCSVLCGASSAGAAGAQAEILVVRSAQAELRGRPSLDATVMGLVRRGEEVELVRSSSDRRWIEVEIGGGELAWIEARALKRGAAAPEPERLDTLRMNHSSSARSYEDRRPREEPREMRNDPPPKPEPRVVRNDPTPKPEPRVVRNDPPPKPEPRVVRNDPPPTPRVAHSDPPPPKREPRVVRNDPSPVKQEVHEPPPEPRLQGRPMRDIPAAKAGELFAAELDDERPPSGPVDTSKRAKK